MVKRAWDLLDTPYRWGGKSVLRDGGLDCSGLVEDCIRTSLGYLPYTGPKTAHDQLKWWKLNHENRVFSEFPDLLLPDGFLIYWWNTAKKHVAHVEICVSSTVSIGARGDSRASGADWYEKAKKHDMRVKCRKWVGRRREIAGIVNPFIPLPIPKEE